MFIDGEVALYYCVTCLFIDVAVPDWIISDDTVMHMATARGMSVCVDGQ